MEKKPVRKYTFSYFGGNALPGSQAFIEADSHDGFYSKLKSFFEQNPQFVLEAGSIGYNEFCEVTDPSPTFGIRTEIVRENHLTSA